MKRKGSNPEREVRGAQHRSEWEEDPVARTYGDGGDEPLEDEEEEELEDEDEEDDGDEEDDYEEDEEEDEEEDDL